MEPTSQVNHNPLIKIEQIVKHDVWDIRQKNDGVFVLKRLPEDNAGAHPGVSGLGANGVSRINAEQSGARPKITVKTPNTNSVVTANPFIVPKKEVVTINTSSTPKMDVLTFNMPAAPRTAVITGKPRVSPRKGVITMKTTTTPKLEVITINTEKSPKKKEVAFSQVKDNFSVLNLNQQIEHGDGDTDSEAFKIQEMFPEMPLNLISDDLKITGSAEITIENILDGKLIPPVPSYVPPVVPSSRDEADPQQSKMEAKVPETKKSGTVIKIELLPQNEIWDIKKKDKEGYVMKKVSPEDDSHPQKNNWSSRAENCTEAMEEEPDDLLEDIFDRSTPCTTKRDENAPVEIMVYSQSSNKDSPMSKRRAVANSSEARTETSMEIDNLNPGGKVPLDSFDFSDNEDEECITIQQFLFKASLELKKLKYLNEVKSQKLGDSALLSITGGVKNENEKENECATGVEGSDDEYYTDECYTDDGEEEEKGDE